jgi:hypothetical protein
MGMGNIKFNTWRTDQVHLKAAGNDRTIGADLIARLGTLT